MSTLSIHEKINQLPPELLTEIEDYIDFILFKYAKRENNKSGLEETEYLSSIPKMKDSIIEGMNTPIEECDKELDEQQALSKQEQAKQFLADMRKDSFVGDVISPVY